MPFGNEVVMCFHMQWFGHAPNLENCAAISVIPQNWGSVTPKVLTWLNIERRTCVTTVNVPDLEFQCTLFLTEHRKYNRIEAK